MIIHSGFLGFKIYDKGFIYCFEHDQGFGFVWLQGDLRNRDDLEKLFSKTKYVNWTYITFLVLIV